MTGAAADPRSVAPAQGPVREALRLYTDVALIPSGAQPSQLLVPLLGNFFGHSGYDRLAEEGREWLSLVGPEDAEVALLPFDGRELVEPDRPRHAEALRAAAEFEARARRAGLRALALVNSDTSRRLPLRDALTIRTSLFRRTRGAHEFALPAWHEDLVRERFGGEIVVRPKRERAAVGFCGLAASSAPGLKRRIKRAVQRVGERVGRTAEDNDGVHLRRRAMDAIRGCARVEARFVVREHCFHRMDDEETRDRQRREYVENIVDTDYTLCVRGYGNFSFRFFEALSLGRIPALVDTECVLPVEFLQDYRELCVIVPAKRVASLGDAIAEHYAGLTDPQFRALQRRVREFWRDRLAPESFFREIACHWRAGAGRAEGGAR